MGKKASKPLAVTTCRSCSGGRSSQPHGTVCWRDPRGPRTYTNLPTLESAPEGPNLLVGSRKVTESWCGIVPSLTPPPHTVPQHHYVVTTPWILRLLSLQPNRRPDKIHGPNERTHQNSNNITMWWWDSQPIRSRVQNTANQDAYRNNWVCLNDCSSDWAKERKKWRLWKVK